MIKHFWIMGDTHGRVADALNKVNFIGENKENAVIILGDAGLNFWLSKTDQKEKERVQSKNVIVYCVHGNHEERPDNLPNMRVGYDEDVYGLVWVEENYPNIRYLIDGTNYCINGLETLVIGGAYSVDKYYRINHYRESNGWCGWFESEQLTPEQRQKILRENKGKDFDMVLTHTCPISWEPTDLFLPQVDQQSVDKSTELFLDDIRQNIQFKYWFFGHYHDDRLVRPGVQMFYQVAENLDDIIARWDKFQEVKQVEEWWLRKDPHFYEEDK